MIETRGRGFLFLLALVISISLPTALFAVSAGEILRESMNRYMGETFRMGLHIKTFSSTRKSQEFYGWFVGKRDSKSQRFFLEFEEPQDAAGMRFLLERFEDKSDRCYMYLPATNDTAPLAPDDPEFSIGATGITMDDLPGLMSYEMESASLIKEEEIAGAKCLVVSIPRMKNRMQRVLWITKEELKIIRLQQVGPDGTVRRESNTLEFFTDAGSRELPKKVEIRKPMTGERIYMTVDHVVYNVEIADELMDPDKFGSAKWRIEPK